MLQGVAQTVKEARHSLPSSSSVAERPLVLSVGATPTTTSIQHPGFFSDEENDDGDEAAAATPGVPGTLKAVMRDLKADGFTLEMHAGGKHFNFPGLFSFPPQNTSTYLVSPCS